jgi:hypothetical protein
MEPQDSPQMERVLDRSREPYEPPRASFIALKLEERLSRCHYWENVYKCGSPRS